jgi:hypothetical protein
MSTTHARDLGQQITIFGFAIVEHFKALWSAFSPQSPHRSPAYTYTFNTRLYGPDDKFAVTANNDTIYGGCALDLRGEPVTLRVPAIADRFYSIQFISATTDDFAYVGTRATGTAAGTYLIAGPNWHGETPAGIDRVLHCPSLFAIAPVRLAVSDEADLANVARLQDQFVLAPLSSYLQLPAPSSVPEMAWPPFYDARIGDLDGFLRTLAFMMQLHVFPAVDQPMLDALAQIGIGPGMTFNKDTLSPDVWSALQDGFEGARREIAQKADHIGPVIHGWSYSPANAGRFGTDYLVRSATAWKYIYVQAAEEALYPTADVDSENRQLDGANGQYELRFAAGALPPVKFFWSVTMYDKQNGLLVRNPINRYSISDRTPNIQHEAGGGLRIIIQADAPAAALQSNWLPAPREPFYVCLRCYGPASELLSGQYTVPAIHLVSATKNHPTDKS